MACKKRQKRQNHGGASTFGLLDVVLFVADAGLVLPLGVAHEAEDHRLRPAEPRLRVLATPVAGRPTTPHRAPGPGGKRKRVRVGRGEGERERG